MQEKDLLQNIGRRVLAGEPIRRSDFLQLVAEAGDAPWDLFYQAYMVRKANFGRAVRLCSIVPGKMGNCSEDCKWCAQSHPSAPGVTEPSRTSLNEIVQASKEADSLGSAFIGIVNSGRSPSKRDLQEVTQAGNAIAENPNTEIQACASLGMLSDLQAKELAASGIVRYHNNLETSRRFFPKMVSTHTFDEKLQTLKNAKNAGLAICCGALFGLGETWEDRIDLAFTLRDEVQPSVVPMNFLCAMPCTPMESTQPMSPIEILTTIAIYRLILPKVDLKIAGGREKNLRDMQSWIFLAGATSCMVGNYLTTAGRDAETDLKMLKDLGLEIVKEFSDPS